MLQHESLTIKYTIGKEKQTEITMFEFTIHNTEVVLKQNYDTMDLVSISISFIV